MTPLRALTATLLLSTLALAAAPSTAAARPGSKGKHLALTRPGVLKHVAERLKLDSATVEEIKAVVYAAEEELVPLESAAKLARLRLRRMLDSPGADRGDVLDQVEDVGQAELAVKRRRMELLLDVRSHLTPSQIEKLGEVRREMKRERKQRKGEKHNKHQRRMRRGGPHGVDGGGPDLGKATDM